MSETPDANIQHRTLYSAVPKPDHVPDDRVVDFDYFHQPGFGKKDVYEVWKELQDSSPDIIWTPRNGGHWIATRRDDMKFIQENYKIFSHEEFIIPRGALPMKMLPLTVDPPLHARYRMVLNPFFRPASVNLMKDKAEALTLDLIHELQPKGRCEFLNDFARVMPAIMFFGIADLPLDRREEFLGWGETFTLSTDPRTKFEALDNVTNYLKEIIDQRYKNPGNDILSAVAGWRDSPYYEGEDEVTSLALQVFFGGLDTVAYLSSFAIRELASHPHLRQRLVEEPEIMPRAVEEFLRRFGLSNTGRLVKQDFEFKGVTFKQGDMVMVSNPLGSIDERAYDRPMEIDFDRKDVVHNTFGNGPHRCVGMHLARLEIGVFLFQWLKHIPEFQLDPEHSTVTHGGHVVALNELHLMWEQ